MGTQRTNKRRRPASSRGEQHQEPQGEPTDDYAYRWAGATPLPVDQSWLRDFEAELNRIVQEGGFDVAF